MKKLLEKITAFVLAVFLVISIIPKNQVSSEGASAKVYLKTTQNTVHPGKTFDVTLMINPNSIMEMTNFEGVIEFDKNLLDVVKEGQNVKITKPSYIPKEFEIEATLDDKEIVFLSDEEVSNPIEIKGEVPLITFSFKVKDNASKGDKASFRINDCIINILSPGEEFIESIYVDIQADKSVEIGAKLDVNNFLTSLSFDEGELSPAFHRETYDYRLNVPEDVTSVTANYQREVQTSSVSVTGADNLNYGDNSVVVLVTAQDPGRRREYRITVHRAFPEPETETPVSKEPETTEESEFVSEEPTPVATESTVFESETSEESESGTDEPEKINNTNPWKTATFILSGVMFIILGIVIWLLFDKFSNRDRIVKIERR